MAYTQGLCWFALVTRYMVHYSHNVCRCPWMFAWHVPKKVQINEVGNWKQFSDKLIITWSRGTEQARCLQAQAMLENLPLGSLRKPPSHFLSRGSTLFSLSYETPLNITEAKGTNLFVSEWTFIFAPNISIVSHHHEVLLPSFLLQEERCLSYKVKLSEK